MRIEPLHGLVEGLFLGKLDNRLGDVATDREAMLHSAEKVDLPGHAGALEYDFRFMPLLDRKDLVSFYDGRQESSETVSKSVRLPAAAMLKGPLILSSSLLSTKLG